MLASAGSTDSLRPHRPYSLRFECKGSQLSFFDGVSNWSQQWMILIWQDSLASESGTGSPASILSQWTLPNLFVLS